MASEYVVVPAPKKAPRVKGTRSVEMRFAHALSEVMNTYAAEGWEYQRSDTLPCEERAGLTGTKTVFHTVLVFRRDLGQAVYGEAPADFDSVPDGPAKDGSVLGTSARQEPPATRAAPRLGPASEPGAHSGDAGIRQIFPQKE